MLKLNRSDYDIIPASGFPAYWQATDEQLRSALYDSDAVGDDPEHFYYILDFDDIRNDFDSWTPDERAEYLQDSDTDDYTVFDWIRDCMMNSLAVIDGFTRTTPH